MKNSIFPGNPPPSQNHSSTTKDTKIMAPSPGNLQLDIVVSDNLNFVKQWMTTGRKHAPRNTAVRETVPGKMLHCAFLVGGFSASPQKQFNVSVHWKLIKPDGSVMFEQRDFAAAQGRMPSAPAFAMANNVLDLVLEADDQPGQYLLKATAEDRVNGSTATASYPITLRAPKEASRPWNSWGQL